MKNITAGGNFILENGAVTEPMNLEVSSSFTNEWDLQATFTAKEAQYVDSYNKENGTHYILLPAEFYTLPVVNVAKGENGGKGVILLNGEALAPGNYLLPVSLTVLNEQPGVSINIDSETVTFFSVIKAGNEIARDSWSITANTEELTGEATSDLPDNGKVISMIDGLTNSFWHSAWMSGEVAPPYEIIIDLSKENSFSQIGLLGRQEPSATNVINMEIYAGNDGMNWELISGFTFDSAIKSLQIFPVKPCSARWLRVYIPSLASGTVGYMAELYLYNTDE